MMIDAYLFVSTPSETPCVFGDIRASHYLIQSDLVPIILDIQSTEEKGLC